MDSGMSAKCVGCGQPIVWGEELCPACRTEPIALADLPVAPPAVPPPLPSRSPPPLPKTAPRTPALPEEFPLSAEFIGRKPLVDELANSMRRSFAERRLLFLALTGPSGIGKSRLGEELGRTIAASLPDARILSARAGDSGAPSFAAWARLLSLRFGIQASESAEVAQEKILRGVEAALPGPRAIEVAHLCALLMHYPFPESPIVEPLAETPNQLEMRLFIAVKRLFAADARRAPLLLVVDDVDRASPETVNLLHYLAAGLADQPVVLVVMAGPELFETHPSFGKGAVALETIPLRPLNPDESAALLAALCRPAGVLPTHLARHAREQMGGSPRALFELARYLLEVGAITRTARGWSFDSVRLGGAPLPATLAALVAARLETVQGLERDLLGKAAVMGERSWFDALLALVRTSSAMFDAHGDPIGPAPTEMAETVAADERARKEIETALGALARRSLLAESPHSSIPGEREYRFAYPPWWEVVYEGLAPEVRRRYHRLVAQWLELRPEGRDEEAQEEIGRHLERAGDGEAAALRYRRAAEAARARYFNDRAIRLYTQALQCLGAHDIAGRIELWHDLGSVHQLRGEQEAALDAFDHMLRLAWLVASRTKAAVAFNKMGRTYRQRGDLHLALDYLERGLTYFRQTNDQRGVAGSQDDIGQVLWLLGRYEEALDASAAGLEQRRAIGDQRSIAVSLLNIGHIERHRGLFTEAESCYREALAIRTELGDRGGIAASRNGLGVLAFQRGDFDGARHEWEEALSIAEQTGALPLAAVLESHLGEVAKALGNLAEARVRFDRCLQLAHDLDDRRISSEATRHMGMIELAGGNSDKARELCERALAIADQAGIRVDVGRAFLALGEVYSSTLFDGSGAPAPEAESYFQRGVDLFREIGNDAELGIGLERFGTFCLERGENEAGRRLLTEAEQIFTRLGMLAGGDTVRRMITEIG